jgi:flagellar biogenesis protein FliO
VTVLFAHLLITAALSSAAASPAAPAPTAAAATEAPVRDPEAAAVAPDEPPPSAWDRRQAELRAGKTPAGPAPDDDISWGAQLLKTVVALALVIGLLYVLFRLGLTRFIGVAALRGPGKMLRVLERQQLDSRHALFVVEVEGTRRMLIGTGERGIQRLADLDGAQSVPRGEFSTQLDAAAKRDAETRRPREEADETTQG